MLELTYIGSELKFEVSFRNISEHVCEIVGSVPHATTGFTLSRIGKQDGWDYSDMPFNILGQVCLPFSALWVLLSALAIILDDYLRYWLYHEEQPHYRWR